MFLKNVLFLLQEFDRFKSFANSLLSRSNKLSELISDLQAAADYVEKGPDTPEGARVKKSGSKLFHLVTFRWRTVNLINSSIVLGPLPYDTDVATQGSGQPGCIHRSLGGWIPEMRAGQGEGGEACQNDWSSTSPTVPWLSWWMSFGNLKCLVGPGRVISHPFAIPSSDENAWWTKPFHHPIRLQTRKYQTITISHLYSLTKKILNFSIP